MLAVPLLALGLGGCIVQLPGSLEGGEEETSEGGEGSEGSTEPSTTNTSDASTGAESDTDPDTEGESDTEGDTGGEVGIDGDGCQERLDVLVVVDNSGSMGVLQRRLAESVGALLGPLDDAGVDWRLGITTTDVGNPWCPTGQTTPESGQLQLESCNEHLVDFTFNSGQVDVSDSACTDICPYAPGKLVTSATSTDVDPNPAPRPWIERIDGVSNLPGDVDPGIAALCLVPQGINGCGFEQPLEASRRALTRALTPGDPQYGFMREDASLLVIIVSDEVDCSHNPEREEIFSADGNKVFWSDPTSAFPSSAVCWNAGVRCVGDPSGYDSCVAQDYDLEGQLSDSTEAVLWSIDSYRAELEALEQAKRAIDPGADVGLLVLGGVGFGGEVLYAEVGDSDPGHQQSFGIGPGCIAPEPLAESGEISALPLVRMRELAEGMSSEGIGSVCAPNFSEPFAAALERTIGQCEG